MIEKIKKLREITNISLNECKKALEKTDGNIDDALVLLKGVQSDKAKKRLSQDANEGKIHTYIHTGGKIASIVEINCETDFAAKSPIFNNLCELICLQVVAMQPIYVSKEDISEEQISLQIENMGKYYSSIISVKDEREKELFINEKMKNWYREVVLMEQTSVIDQSKSIKELVESTSAQLGEKVQIARFERWSI